MTLEKGTVLWRDAVSGLVLIRNLNLHDIVEADMFRGFGGVKDPVNEDIMEDWVKVLLSIDSY